MSVQHYELVLRFFVTEVCLDQNADVAQAANDAAVAIIRS